MHPDAHDHGPQAGSIGPIRREIVFEPLPEPARPPDRPPPEPQPARPQEHAPPPPPPPPRPPATGTRTGSARGTGALRTGLRTLVSDDAVPGGDGQEGRELVAGTLRGYRSWRLVPRGIPLESGGLPLASVTGPQVT